MKIEDAEIEKLARTMANAKLGEGDSVRCEGPTEFEVGQARPWARRALAALAYAPAPASGGVDAVGLVPLKWRHVDVEQYEAHSIIGTYEVCGPHWSFAPTLKKAGAEMGSLDEAREAAQSHRDLFGPQPRPASLSPAAMPVSEAEPVAWRDVLAERRRQVETEGWTAAHDDEHGNGEMAQAAAVYALCSAASPPNRAVMDEFGQYNSVPFKIRNFWPWGENWLKPKDRRSDLVRAAALILAEIERLDRKEVVR